jgi:hypothetical protein
MRVLTTLIPIVLTLALPGRALAAPPPNDNRADAAAIPTFPSTLPGTTAEATVERLDPQVSRCGRVESTVWYRVDTAPDGVVSISVTGAAGVAPVLRLYRRTASAIQEADCASAGPGGTATASLEAVRGSNYLVLVGRRPGTTDGPFEVRAELFLPPANDEPGGAQALRLPGSVRGSTLGATAGEADPGCGLAAGTVWYRMASRRDGTIMLRLAAQGSLDAAVAVLERVRSRVRRVACRGTDGRGRAVVAFPSRRGATYLVAVGQVAGSAPGTFQLQSLLSEPAESRAAGRALPRGGVRSTVHALTDVNDVWRITMQPGITYRIGFSSDACAYAVLRPRRQLQRALAILDCAGYTTFTPGPDGAGAYVLEVRAGPESAAQPYRLRVAPAAADDLGVGVLLQNRRTARASLDPAQLDVRDVYHFDVERRSDVRIAVTGGIRFQLVRDDGARLGTFATATRRLEPGRYVVAVSAAVGEPGVRYSLSLLVREITTTTLRLAAPRVALGATVELRPSVTNASSGLVELQIDRFDPLTGWHFHRLLRLAAGSSASWRPPAEGRWRIRASYRGTVAASPSRSGYALLEVRR